VRPSLRSLSALVVLLLLVAGCGAVGGLPGGAAATVDGEQVPRDRLESAVRELTAETPEDGAEASVEDTQRQVLTLLIQAKIIENLAAEEGIEVADDDVQQRIESDREQAGGEEEFAQMLAFQNLTVELYEDVLVPAQLRVDELRQQLAADEPAVQARTARHILVGSEEEARTILDELEEGADFADLAAEYSEDTGSGAQGGDLGSAPRDSYVPEFDDAVWGAQVGELVGPIESQFGFHLIEVTDEEETPASELDVQQLEELVGEELAAMVGTAFGEADVEVDSAFGRWDPEATAVVPADQVGEGTGNGLEPAPDDPGAGEPSGDGQGDPGQGDPGQGDLGDGGEGGSDEGELDE
jgi:parvulin-like peptidyl-prolyl isomerase